MYRKEVEIIIHQFKTAIQIISNEELNPPKDPKKKTAYQISVFMCPKIPAAGSSTCSRCSGPGCDHNRISKGNSDFRVTPRPELIAINSNITGTVY